MTVSLPNRRVTSRSRSTGTSIVWPIASSYLGIIVYVFSGHGEAYPATLVALVSFGGGPILFSGARPLRSPVLCPLNWTLAVFFLQLVVVPLLVCVFGPDRGVLHSLPSDNAVNIALLLSATAFWAFVIGLHASLRMRRRRGVRATQKAIHPTRGLGMMFIGIGMLGTLLAFGGVGGLAAYFSHTTPDPAELAHASDSATNVIGIICRSFLGFGFVVLWSIWISARAHGRLATVVVTALTAVLTVISYSTFSYNRGAFVAPLVALLAVYGTRVRRLSLPTILMLALLGVFLLGGFRLFRGADASLGEGLTSQRGALLGKVDLNKELQVYAAAPQYLGFLLEQTHYAEEPSYGRGLLGSLMAPVPGLGKPFRSTSDVAVYNRLIYGSGTTFQDQVVPLQGELYINFLLPGLLAGYLLLGMLVGWLQDRFADAQSALTAFCWQYAATWIAFLAVGSLAVVSQIFVYFFWPVYAMLAVRTVRQAVRRHRIHEAAAHA